LFCLFLLSFTVVYDADVLQDILQKLEIYRTTRGQQKVYLHFDKPFYAAGEKIWFKTYLVEASLHTPDSQSRVVYVELIDQTKTILKRQMLYAPNGMTHGDMHLADSLPQGRYAIRAYTNYMKNAGEDFFFTREFSILNPSIVEEEEPAFHRDSIALQFFAEGGNLVACGAENRIGFKALSPDGKSIAVAGEILDELNNIVTTFQTQHDGMGVVKLNPGAEKKYSARITKPYLVKRSYPLPPVHAQG
jgi:hypothetical protein